MLLIDPLKCEYGPATEPIRKILRLCDWNWERMLDHHADPNQAAGDLKIHLQQVSQLPNMDTLEFAPTEIIYGDWKTASEIARDSRRHGIWSSALDKVFVAAKSTALKSVQLQRWAGPPIWCFPNVINAKNPLVIDTHLLPKFIKKEQKDIAWRLMCNVEDCLSRAILVAMLNCFSNSEPIVAKQNVFESLLKVYCRGMFPIEFVDGKFVVFVP